MLQGYCALPVVRRNSIGCQTPKSGDIMRCVNVVDSLGFPQVYMDNQKHLY